MLFPKPAHKEKVKKGLNRYRKSPIARAKKKAWDIFSLYTRLKNSKDGICICYTCERPFYYKEGDAGHGIEGRNNAVLFMEEVVKPQDKQCNIFKLGNLRVFTRKLIEELGLKKYNELEFLSNQTIIYKEKNYLAIYELYKEKLSQLEVRSGNIFFEEHGLN